MNVTVRITKPLQKFIPTQKLCIDVHDYNAVSYTHLTLPTILLV